MKRGVKSAQQQKGAQKYDSTLKSWVKDDPKTIIPVLLPGAVFQEAVDIEVIKPTMRADRVFKVLYKGIPHLLNIEFESGADAVMRKRLLVYNAVLHMEYTIPVISSIVYPFRTTTACSPLRILLGQEEELLIFHFFTLPLFQLEAEHFMREHVTCMYPLLPTMEGANIRLITQAMEELAALYRDDEVTLSQQLVWMELLLERTTLIDARDNVDIQEVLRMYDPLWDEHPKVKKIKATATAEARAEAKAQLEVDKAAARAEAKAQLEAAKARVRAEAEAAKAEVKAQLEADRARFRFEAEIQEKAVIASLLAEAELVKAKAELDTREKMARLFRENLLDLVRMRFPEATDLLELTGQAASHIVTTEGMSHLLFQVASAANEHALRHILQPSAA